ncbi:MAG: tRNA (adenosine(37)-N6)-threonylcarbamoyltransferase complex dimerization subunit type 1 TsaB [bacterium]
MHTTKKNMLILGIETATATCAAALWQEGTLLGEIRFKQKKIHAEFLSGMIRQLMDQSRNAYSALKGIAISIGPGSFTGLRIGMAMAKGIAYAQNIDVVGIHTPDAIASNIVPDEMEMIVVLPSRKGEVYAARYKNLDGAYHREDEIAAIEIARLPEWADGVRLAAGPGIHALMKAGLKNFTYLPERFWEIGAGPIARLGARKLMAEGPDAVATLEPDYIKPFQTTMAISS